MNVEAVAVELRTAYPAANIVIGENRSEIVAEIEPGRAVAVIEAGSPHFHVHTAETYRVLKGSVALFLGGRGMVLTTGESQLIEPGVVHWARGVGEPAWVEARSTPPWRPEDHFAV